MLDNAQDPASAASIDQSRLRATLRLIFAGDIADRIAASGHGATTNATIGRVLRSATRQWRWGRLRRRIGRRRDEQQPDLPLAVQSSRSAFGSVALALQLGLGLTGDALAEAGERNPREIGAELYRARSALASHLTPACAAYIAAIGRYRDPSLDLNSRASMLHHAQQCAACRAALDQFQAIDARLLDQIDQHAARLPEPAAPHRLQPRPSALLTAGFALVAIVILGAFVVANGLVRHRPGADSVRASASQSLDGWALTADSTGAITALNLSTWQQHQVVPAKAGSSVQSNGLVGVELSPNRKLIARQQVVLSETVEPHQLLEIDNLDGEVLQTFTLPGTYGAIAGWIDNDTIAVTTHPLQRAGDNQSDYISQLESDSQLIACDVVSGSQHELFQGAIAQASLSPDGTLVAITASFRQSTDQSIIVELRPLANGQVGEPLATIRDAASIIPVWAPDSSRVYLGVTHPVAATPTATAEQSSGSPNLAALWISPISVDRDGTVTALPPLPAAGSDLPIDVSPDGQRLFRETFDQTGTATRFRLWQTTAAGAQPQPLTDESPAWVARGIWSPDGTIGLLLSSPPFFLDPSPNESLPNDVRATRLIALDLDGTIRPFISSLAFPSGTDFVGWLPADAFPAPATPEPPSRVTEPAPVDLEKPNLALDPRGMASPDGRYMILDDRDTTQPIVWDRTTSSGRSLPDGTHDLSWFPDSRALIGAGEFPVGPPDIPNRLITFAPSFNVSSPAYDYRAYDPAEIGSSKDMLYALPLMSPDENTLAFFVTDERDRSVALWLVGYEISPHRIEQWTIPPDRKLFAKPVATWIDARTLLVAEPDAWQSGLPGKALLKQVHIDPDGNASVSTVTTLRTHGTERGIALEELAVNRAAGHVAYRLRHFAKRSTTDDAFDTIEITSTTDLDGAIEVARASPANGLSWSPDGQALAAISPGKISFFTGSGKLLGRLSGLTNPAAPQWVAPTELWFSEGEEQGEQIVSVELK